MFDYRLVRTVSIVGAIFFGIIAGMNILDWYNDKGDWCAQNIRAVDCVREWLSATSGWFAATVAGITLVALKMQLDEQRKQTAFIVGDAEPTMDVLVDQGDSETIHARITNWNRRSILILEIANDQPVEVVAVAVKMGGEYIPAKRWAGVQGWGLAKPIVLDGWIDKSKAPPFVRIEINGLNKDGNLVKFDAYEGVFTATVTMVSDTHKKLMLIAAAGVGT